MRRLISRLVAKTPKFGKTLRNVGAAIIGLEAAAFTLPEIPDSYMQIAYLVVAVVLIIKGQLETAQDVLEEAKKVGE